MLNDVGIPDILHQTWATEPPSTETVDRVRVRRFQCFGSIHYYITGGYALGRFPRLRGAASLA